MVSRDDWIVVGLILGAVAVVGIAIFVLKKKPTGQKIQLKKVGERRVIMSNEERVTMERDREGNLKELVIHREVTNE